MKVYDENIINQPQYIIVMNTLFIPYLCTGDASVEKIINALHDSQIGVVEYVHLIGRKDFDGNYYYEAYVCFAHIYNNDIGSYIKHISTNGGMYTVHHNDMTFILLKCCDAPITESTILDIESRVSSLEKSQQSSYKVTGESLIMRKHEWNKLNKWNK